MSKLRTALDQYLNMRKGLGYKYEHQTKRLSAFVAFMELRLTDVRGFARHVANFDPRTVVPPVGILRGWKRAKPHVYSDPEVNALLAAALALPPVDGLRR